MFLYCIAQRGVDLTPGRFHWGHGARRDVNHNKGDGAGSRGILKQGNGCGQASPEPSREGFAEDDVCVFTRHDLVNVPKTSVEATQGASSPPVLC